VEETNPTAEVRSRVLIVDDEQGPRESLRMILSPGYEVLCARDGLEALEVLQTAPVDVVTLDLNMPGIKGEELMHRLASRFPSVEIIVITGYATLRSATEGIRAGIADYLAKPFDVAQVIAAVARAVARGRGRRRLADFLEALGEILGRERDVDLLLAQIGASPALRSRTLELVESAGRAASAETGAGLGSSLAFFEVLAETLEARGTALRGHARRVAWYAGLLAERLGLHASEQAELRCAAFLHDLGQVGVPSHLLERPGPLEAGEQEALRRHVEIGTRLLQPLAVPRAVADGVRHHHERWDGGGYPDRLHGAGIPLAARIIALADAYDAMTSARPHREALSPEAACAELERGAGSQFDPELTKEFLALVESGACDGEVDSYVVDALRVTGAGMRSGGAGRAVDRSVGAAR
jgi:response regulator RpfG family c-di-GMP phosphodiesterase